MRRKVWLSAKVILPVVLLVVVFCLPPAVHAHGRIHVVRRGENLYRIARAYGTTVQAIAHANRLSNPNYIWVGQRLYIPAPGSGAGPGGCGCVHIVRRGENLSRIAWRYGMSVWALAARNGIRNPNYIWAGQRLCVPCGGWYPPSCGGVHVVRWGETLSSIAWRYGTCVQALMRVNGLWNPNRIYAGQRLTIPCGADP